MRKALAVIGGGPAGLAAALAAREAGVDDVVVIERERELGGILRQCIHNGFGLHYFKEDLSGPEYAERFVTRVYEQEIEHWTRTMVLGLDNARRLTCANPSRGVFTVETDAVVLAMGCRERSRGQIATPGMRPAGIFTAGLAQRLVNMEAFLPGKEAVVIGSGDIGLIMARRLTLEGVAVKAVIEVMDEIGGLLRNKVQCLDDFDIPLYLGHTVTEIRGADRVKAVRYARLNADRSPDMTTEREIPCDTVILSVGLIPENELSRQAGVALDSVTRGPVVTDANETSVSGVFACGNVLQVFDLVDDVTRTGESTGRNAAAHVLGRAPRAERRFVVRTGHDVRTVCPQIVTGVQGKEITITFRVGRVCKKAEVRVLARMKPIHTQRFRVLRPGELAAVTFPASALPAEGRDGTIEVGVW
jgi:NADPH-dependent 2,4-dienoyl-CoA reductase/sulfur reductase-like enzyme